MKDECVVGVYDSIEKAEQGVRILRQSDFPPKQISVVASGLKERPDLAAELKMGDDSVRDAAISAGLGGILAVLAGIGITIASGGGIIVLLAAPIGIAAMGTVVGGLVGAMMGWGVHQEHIQHYEQCLKKGQVLVIATGDPLELVRAERVLRETDVADVQVHARTGAESPEVLAK